MVMVNAIEVRFGQCLVVPLNCESVMHEVIFQFISLFAGGDLIIVIVMLLLS